MLSKTEERHLRHAIDLAINAEQEGNLPIGAVITLNDMMIAEGKNAIWFPEYNQNRHAEIEALRSVPNELWLKSGDMSLYTTLEPCLMCTGAILLHHIGRVVFGA
ncbi:MAG: nucleoside deaminase [Gammaproteobacteria bacterium]|nr:nucleoside deaminase [Gammaproteobacteria bacterium]